MSHPREDEGSLEPQKSYVDKRRQQLEFEARDQVFLRVSPIKGVV